MHKRAYPLIGLLFLVFLANSLDNGVGLTPPMGWNTWNHYHCNISQNIILENAQALINTGLARKGYKYVNLDDCWQISRDPRNGTIVADKNKFPSGIAHLAEQVHQKGLLFGLYSDAGVQTCQGRPGSYNHEQIDANTYAQWKVDFLKYDNCHNEGISAKVRYPLMRDALNKTGRPIYYSMCNWGFEKPWQWAQDVANSWRTTGDIADSWISIMRIFEKQQTLQKYAKPGAWNDPDMLEIGNGKLTQDEEQSHFALWAILKAPLIIGCNLKNISKQSLQILANQEIIQVNQDPLGRQGKIILKQRNGIFGDKEIWISEMAGNKCAIVFFNKSDMQADFTLDIKQYQRQKRMTLRRLRNLIAHQDVAIPDQKVLTVKDLRKHAVSVFMIQMN